MEIWKDIKGYEDIYQISNLGRVKNTKRNTCLKPRIGKLGYCRVALYKNKNPKHILIHRIVANHFIENTYNKETVNHKDGNKQNNNVNNLEWATKSENSLHSFRVLKRKPPINGKGKFGALHPNSKSVIQFTHDRYYIKEYAALADAARENNISVPAVWDCCSGRNKTAYGYIFKYK